MELCLIKTNRHKNDYLILYDYVELINKQERIAKIPLYISDIILGINRGSPLLVNYDLFARYIASNPNNILERID